MHTARVYQVGHGHLVYTAEALVPGVGHDLKDQFIINGNKTVNGVINNFPYQMWLFFFC
jgi:hypothetical protein